jgi:hypothetical protein
MVNATTTLSRRQFYAAHGNFGPVKPHFKHKPLGGQPASGVTWPGSLSGPGTAAGSTTNAAGYPVGAVLINLAAAGTGTILKGDVITFAGDANQYNVAIGNAHVTAGGSITLASGLLQALPASAVAITVVTGGDQAVVLAWRANRENGAIGSSFNAPPSPAAQAKMAEYEKYYTSPACFAWACDDLLNREMQWRLRCADILDAVESAVVTSISADPLGVGANPLTAPIAASTN